MSDISKSAAGKCLEDCTEQQRSAIMHIEGPLLVLAGAGSGKTRVITRRIAYLIANGAPPHDILAITFTNKAANEMRERVERLLGPRSVARPGMPGGGVWIATFHSMCARIMRHHADRLGYNQAFSIYDTSDSLGVVKRIMKELEIPTEDYRPPDILKNISNLKNRLVSSDEYASEAEGYFQKILAKIYRHYTQALKDNNAQDFDDLLMNTEKLLREFPDIQERYARRFRHLLIDEYQDTNRAQYMISRALSSHHRNICVTGDPDQSIYGWRGADLNNILAFEKDYPDAVTIMLDRNFRSTRAILETANKLIVHNKMRKPKDLVTENPEGRPISLNTCENDSAEAKFIAADIEMRARDGISYDDFAIFYRTNAQSRELESALRDARIPHKVVAGVAFYERKEVKDILAYLKACANPSDEESLLRILNTPPRGIGEMSRARLRAYANQSRAPLLDIFARAREAGLGQKQADELFKLARILNSVRTSNEPVAEKVKKILNHVQYHEYLKNNYSDQDERWRNCEELVNLAAKHDAEALALGDEPDLTSFLESMSLSSDQDALNGAKGCVKLMTLHTAKGLEFPFVYITGVEEGLIPLAGPNNRINFNDDSRDVEEERRLFFVGITRAMKELTLTYAQLRRRYGKEDFTMPSRFLREIPGGNISEPRKKPASSYFRQAYSTPPRRPVQRPGRRISAPQDISLDSTVARDSSGMLLKSGDTVRHPTFGLGRVMDISGSGDSARVTVLFGSGQEKRLVLKYAQLHKVVRR